MLFSIGKKPAPLGIITVAYMPAANLQAGKYVVWGV